jgi:hypothetical protein
MEEHYFEKPFAIYKLETESIQILYKQEIVQRQY